MPEIKDCRGGRYTIIFLLLLLSINSTIAQNYTATIKKTGIEEGLSNYNINKIYQASSGLIWLATSYGLNSYDGINVRAYTSESHGLCHNRLHFITEDDLGNLWLMGGGIGGEKHICVFDPIAKKTYTIEEYTKAPCPFIHSSMWICPRYQNGFLLADFYNGNVYELQNKKLELVLKLGKNTTGLDLKKVFKVDDSTFVVPSTSRYATSLNNHFLAYYNTSGELIKKDTFPLDFGRITAFNSDGVNLITFHVRIKKEGISTILSFCNSEDSSIFIPHNSDGLVELIIFNQNMVFQLTTNFLNIYTNKGIFQQQIPLDLDLTNIPHEIIVDQQGNIWFSNNEHLCQINLHKQYFNISLHDKKNPYRIRGISKTTTGESYIGGIGFISKKASDTSDWESGPGFNLPIANYMGFAQYGQAIWMANEYYGLIKYFPETKEKIIFHTPDSIPNSIGWMPYKDPEGNVWLGCTQGIAKIDSADRLLIQFKPQPDFPLLNISSVYSFYRNQRGTWLSTSSGLYLVDLEQEKTLECYSSKQKGQFYIPAEHIAHMFEDKEGVFWLATKGQGLVKWNPSAKDYEHFTQESSGLSSNVLYAVYEDDYNKLWIPSDRGLMRFDKKTKVVTIYQKEDGIPHNEFNTIAHFKDKEGHLYFGTQNGLIDFRPKDFHGNNTLLPFILTSCTKQKQTTDSIVDVTSSLLESHIINIFPDDKIISIEFALLNFNELKTNQYSYKIKGSGQNWIYQTEPSVKIIGLPYGDYQLLLRAKASENSVWQVYPSPVFLKVLRPFYYKWWFIAGLILGLILSVYYIIKRRTKQLLAKQVELEKIVAKRTEKITQQTEEALRESESQKIINNKLLQANELINQQKNSLSKRNQEKETLLKEIHHRVKNNLQIITSLLSLQSLNINDEKVKALFSNSQNRINSMALIHEMLYQNNNLSRINFRDYISQLFDILVSTFKGRDHNIKLELDVPEIYLNVDTAIPLGLLINEIVTNSLKYAFVDNETGLLYINISETENKNYLLKIGDDGPGFPDETDIKTLNSLGLKLINKLIRQIGGDIKRDKNNKGTNYIINFKQVL
jgi:two-component sensor histidine kinase/ligand-binding sensor domain-containing protein